MILGYHGRPAGGILHLQQPRPLASRSGLPRQRGPGAGRDRRLAHGGGEGGAGGQLAVAAAAAWVLSQEEGESRAMG
jgi:hypothetical protein